MTSITFDKDIQLSKTHFRDLEELQQELILMSHKKFVVTDGHKEILDTRQKS